MKKIAFLIGLVSVSIPSLFYSANLDQAICKSLLKNLNVDSIPEAQEKVKGLDELLDSLGEATTVSDALKNYEMIGEQTDRGFNHLAELAGIDVKAITKKAKKEKKPWLLVETIGEAIIHLQENLSGIQGATKIMAAYVAMLEGIITQAVQAKQQNNPDLLWRLIPEKAPTFTRKTFTFAPEETGALPSTTTSTTETTLKNPKKIAPPVPPKPTIKPSVREKSPTATVPTAPTTMPGASATTGQQTTKSATSAMPAQQTTAATPSQTRAKTKTTLSREEQMEKALKRYSELRKNLRP
jgi:hypothetical protein